MKYLYIAFKSADVNDGAKVVSGRNLRFLKQIAGDELEIIYLPKPTLFSVFFSILTLGSYGVSLFDEIKLIRCVTKSNFQWIFIEGSLLGRLVRSCSKKSKVIVFAHNIDARLYKQRYMNDRSLLSLLRYLFVKFNEGKVFKDTTHIITLNKRDSTALKTDYNRDADIESPISFPKVDLPKFERNIHEKNYCLFVGSDFFPNVSGIKWFIENVSPHITMNTWVVGSCCNSLDLTGYPSDNVILKGFVPDLEACYVNSSCVVAPIFLGSGMKTKTIEALSYGKMIYGTSEAFQGVDFDYSQLGGICNSANEFIEQLNACKSLGGMNEYSHRVFSDNYSDEVVFEQFKRFISSIA